MALLPWPCSCSQLRTSPTNSGDLQQLRSNRLLKPQLLLLRHLDQRLRLEITLGKQQLIDFELISLPKPRKMPKTQSS